MLELVYVVISTIIFALLTVSWDSSKGGINTIFRVITLIMSLYGVAMFTRLVLGMIS